MGEKLTPFDPAEGLTSDEAITAFMEEAFKTEDGGYIAHALVVVARAKGMTRSPTRRGCRASSFIGRSARPATRR